MADIFAQHSQSMWPALPQYRHNLFLKRYSRSSLVSLPLLFLGRDEEALTTMLSSLVRIALPDVICLDGVHGELLYMFHGTCSHHTWSKSLAFSTRVARVVGNGEMPISFPNRAPGIACWNAYICVASFAPLHVAWVDHSWYQSLKVLLPIFRVYIRFVASKAICAGMKWSRKFVLKSAQAPKVTAPPPTGFKAAFCLSWAHWPAGVPTLKYVRAVEIFLSSVSKIRMFRWK